MGYWREITTSNSSIHSKCGEDAWHLEHALDLDGLPYPCWIHCGDHTHWCILDLGASYSISKVRSYSDWGGSNGWHPTDVDIYISDSTSSWGTAVATGVSSWNNTSTYVEVEVTPKEGRYIKFVINDTNNVDDWLSWGGEDNEEVPGSIISLYISVNTIDVESSIYLEASYTTETVSTVSSIYIESDLLYLAKRWIGTDEYTVIDGEWQLTGYHTDRCGYTPPNQSVSSFRSECMTGNEVTCSKSTLETNWLNPGNLGAIWWDLTDAERWGISTFIIENWQFYRYEDENHYIVDWWSYGERYCVECDNDWNAASCGHNMLVKYNRMGDCRETWYIYSEFYFKDPTTSNEIVTCFHNKTSWNLPVHTCSSPTSPSGWHGICAFQVKSDATDFDSWRFFQYEDTDIQPGDYQMDLEESLYIFFYRLPRYTDPLNQLHSSGYWEFEVTNDGGWDAEYIQTVEDTPEGPTAGTSQVYGGALYQAVEYYPWDNQWLYIGEILQVDTSIIIGGKQVPVTSSITLSSSNSVSTVSSITLFGGDTYTAQTVSSIYIYDPYDPGEGAGDVVIGNNFDGQIKYARIYDVCMTSGQVLRNSQGNINYNDLVAWWDLTEGTGSTIYNKKDSTTLSGTITNAVWAWDTWTLNASSWSIVRNRGSSFDTATFNISPVYMEYRTGDEIQLYNNTTGATIWSGFTQHRGRIGSDGLVTLECNGLGSDIAYKKVTLDLSSKSPEYILTQALSQLAGTKGRTYTLSTPVASGITIASYSIDDTFSRIIGEMIDRTGYTLRWTPDYTVYFEPAGNSSSGCSIDSSTIGTIFTEWIQDNPESLINKVNVDGEGYVDSEWENYSGSYSHDASIAMYGEHYLHVKVDYLSSDEEAGDLAEKLIRVDPTPGGIVTLPFSHLTWSDICNKTISIVDELRQINGTYTVYSQTINSDGTTQLTVGKDPETMWIDRARERNAIGAERARLIGSSSTGVGGSSSGRSLGMGGGVSSGYSETGIIGGVSDNTQSSYLTGQGYTYTQTWTVGPPTLYGSINYSSMSGTCNIEGTTAAGGADSHTHGSGSLYFTKGYLDHTHTDTFYISGGAHYHETYDTYAVSNPSHGHGDTIDTTDATHPHGDSFVVDPSSHDHTITVDNVTVTDLTKSDR